MKYKKVNVAKWILKPFDDQVKDWRTFDFSLRFEMVTALLKKGFPVKTIDKLDYAVRTPRRELQNR